MREMDEEFKGRWKMLGSTRQCANTGTNAGNAAKWGECDMKVNCLSQGKGNNDNYSNKTLKEVVRQQFSGIVVDLVLVSYWPEHRNWNFLLKN